jgi:seryl-tRNA synthetase
VASLLHGAQAQDELARRDIQIRRLRRENQKLRHTNNELKAKLASTGERGLDRRGWGGGL